MINAGEYVCPYCASRLKDAFYGSSETPVGAFLERDAEGRYYVRTQAPENNAEQYVLDEDSMTYGDGMPSRIYVTEKKSGAEHILVPCCPKCKNALPDFYGTLPTYIIDVVGTVEEGKSAWLAALTDMDNSNHLGWAKYAHTVDVSDISVVWHHSVATEKLEQGNTIYLYLKKDGQEYAIVVLRDFGGELFKQESVGFTGGVVPVIKILEKADAFLFVADETANEERQQLRTRAYGMFRKQCLTGRKPKPFGVILSHADIMMADGGNSRFAEERDMNGEILTLPYLTPDTFLPDTNDSYRPENLLPRIELEDMIAMKCSKFVSYLRLNKIAQKSFIVKSCVSAGENSEGEKMNNYKDGINIYDPLLWVLNQMKLFSLQ